MGYAAIIRLRMEPPGEGLVLPRSLSFLLHQKSAVSIQITWGVAALFYIIKKTAEKGHSITMYCAQRKEKDANNILNT